MKLTDLTDDQYQEFTLRLAETVVDSMDYKTMDSVLVGFLMNGYKDYSREALYVELCEWLEEEQYDDLISHVTSTD